MCKTKRTIKYYDQKSQEFFDNTVSVKFKDNQDRFLKYLKPGMRILDFGSGSGRDTKYFISNDFIVDAIDGSLEMCKLSSSYTGQKTIHMSFDEFDSKDMYDAVWACASILHLEIDDIIIVFGKIFSALKKEGIFYTSFKLGEFEGMIGDRYFTYMTEQKLRSLVNENSQFEIEEMWISTDVREDRENEKWINSILRKNN